jgi:3-oxoacyl-[acyl-carrier protein] reductase
MLGSASDATHVVRTAADRFGAIDCVIANAGTWRGGRLKSMSPSDWNEVVSTNLGGLSDVIRAATPNLSPDGSIVILSSVIGRQGFPGDTAYATVKAGMVGFARALAKELSPAGIRVNVLAPGFVETDMTAHVSERAREKLLERTLLGRFGTPDEVAAAAVFLAIDATYMTGAVLTVDGGWSL